MRKTRLKSKSKTPESKLQKKCDSLLTPIVKILHPKCLLCGLETQVAHHHVHKSKSNALRYNFDNLINLCSKCHLALHHNESYYASKIVTIKGVDWFEDIERIKNQVTIKADIVYYTNKLEELEEYKNKLDD